VSRIVLFRSRSSVKRRRGVFDHVPGIPRRRRLRERAGEGVVRDGLAAVPVEELGVRTDHRVAVQDEARQDHGRA
jgi:hypothetical protein